MSEPTYAAPHSEPVTISEPVTVSDPATINEPARLRASPQPGNWQPLSWAEPVPRPTLGPGHRRLGRGLTILLAACVGVNLLFVLLDIYGIALFNRWEADPSTILLADGEYFDMMTLLLGGLNSLVLIATGICTITWLYQAYSSREADPKALKHKRWWTIGGWLIPFISLVRPFQLFRDLYLATTGSQPEERMPWTHVKTPVRFRWWWGTYLLGNLLLLLATSMLTEEADIGELKASLSVDLASQVVTIAAAVLFISVLREITINLRRRANGLV